MKPAAAGKKPSAGMKPAAAGKTGVNKPGVKKAAQPRLRFHSQEAGASSSTPKKRAAPPRSQDGIANRKTRRVEEVPSTSVLKKEKKVPLEKGKEKVGAMEKRKEEWKAAQKMGKEKGREKKVSLNKMSYFPV